MDEATARKITEEKLKKANPSYKVLCDICGYEMKLADPTDWAKTGYDHYLSESREFGGAAMLQDYTSDPMLIRIYSKATETLTVEDKTEDVISNPSHYCRNGVECRDWIRMCLTEEEYRGWLKGSYLKYLFRHGHKDDAEQDLKKAKQFIDFELEELE